MARLNDLDTAVRKSGLRIRVQPGWKSRGRGGFRGARGIILHHTAGPASGNYPSLNVVMYGRPGLRNALSHLGLGRDGSVYVIASGLCWHAGRGSGGGLSGNSDTIGIEAESTGRGDWTSAQVDAYPRLVAALKAHYNIPNSRVLSHALWAVPRGRKIDPYGFPGGLTALRGGSVAPTPEPKEWWESLSAKDRRRIEEATAKKVLQWPTVVDGFTAPIPLHQVIARTQNFTRDNYMETH